MAAGTLLKRRKLAVGTAGTLFKRCKLAFGTARTLFELRKRRKCLKRSGRAPFFVSFWEKNRRLGPKKSEKIPRLNI